MTRRLYKPIFWVFLCLLAALFITLTGFGFENKETTALSHYIMAGMYDRQDQPDKAVTEYKKALKSDYENPSIHLSLATSLIRKNDFVQAVDELKLAGKFAPEAVEPHLILALVYSLQNKSDLANSEYEIALKQASKLQPKNIDIYKSLGLIYTQQKKYPAAENVYRLVLGLAPNDPEAHFYLANIYNDSNKFDAAETELKKAIAVKPDYAEALNFLGYLYVEKNKNLDQAEVMINKALELEPENGAYLDSLGWLYFKQNKINDATEYLTRAAGLLEDPEIYNHLGELYLKLGNKESAKLNWQKSLKLDPKQETVREKLEKADKEWQASKSKSVN